MTEAEALRVLGIEVPYDKDSVRDAFAAQMRKLRGARNSAAPGLERERIERALTLTLMARECLLPAQARAFAVTQEVTRIRKPGYSRAAIGILLLGLGMLLGALLPLPPWSTAANAEVDSDLAAPAQTASRQALDPVRTALSLEWQQAGLQRLPAQTSIQDLDLPAPPAGWRWQAQRDGAFSLIDASGEDWLLAAPLLEDGGLRWACFSRRSGRSGCFVLAVDPVLERRVQRGQVDARLLADVLARMPAAQRDEAWSAERWYRQALRQAGRAAGRAPTSALPPDLLARSIFPVKGARRPNHG